MEKEKNVIELTYADVCRDWESGNYFSAILKTYMAPQFVILNAMRDFLRTDSTLSEDDGDNLERIILAGEKANAKKLRIKITKKELTGANVLLGKLKSKSNLGATIGKESESEYFIDVEYDT